MNVIDELDSYINNSNIYKNDTKYIPFWNKKCSKLSKKLWKPSENLEERDSDGVNIKPLKSWFNSTIKFPENEVKVPIFNKAEIAQDETIRTLKIRLFPTETQINTLKSWGGLCRWTWNTALMILKTLKNAPIYLNEETKKEPDFQKFSNIDIRNFVLKVDSKIEAKQETKEKIYHFIYNEDKAPSIYNFPQFEKCNFPVKAYRGVIDELTGAIKSLISNNRKLDSIKLKTKKTDEIHIPFDQWSSINSPFPIKHLGNIKGYFRIGRKKVNTELLFRVIEQRKYTIKNNGKNWYLLMPCSTKNLADIKNLVRKERKNNPESQVGFINFLISLDPGIRTFQTGYALNHIVELGNKDTSSQIQKLLLKYDELNKTHVKGKKLRLLRLSKRISDLIDEMHWKIIGFLVKNYEIIIYPVFRITSMVRKSTLPDIVKRLMYRFKFYKFEQRLIYKCQEWERDLRLVDESYTSKTCGNCGELNMNLGSDKVFNCSFCKFKIDRDINGARNILIKNA